MLKAHQACIDLEKGVLRIQGREVSFLSEHELPDKAREPPEMAAQSSAGPSTGGSSFPGGGHTLGSTPASGQPGGAGGSAAPARGGSRHPEKNIRTIMDLGVPREIAISTLDAAGGNVDVAASLLF